MDSSDSLDVAEGENAANKLTDDGIPREYLWGAAPRDVLEMIIEEARRRGKPHFRKIMGSMRLTCRTWCSVVNDGVTQLHTKAIWKKPLSQLLQKFCHVHTVKLTAVRDEALEVLIGNPRITNLDVSEGCLKLPGIKAISMCTQLRTLNLSGCDGISNTAFNFLGFNSLLESLDTSECEQLTGISMPALRKMRNLSSLVLKDCVNIRVAHLHLLAELTSLRSLDLTGVDYVNDALLLDLRALHSLRVLKVRGCRRITDMGVAALTSLDKLETIDISFCPLVTDLSVDCLAKLTSLTELHLYLCVGISSKGVNHLSRLTSLEVLNIQGLSGTPDDLVGLSVLNSLRLLDMRGMHAFRRDVMSLKRTLGPSQVTIVHS